MRWSLQGTDGDPGKGAQLALIVALGEMEEALLNSPQEEVDGSSGARGRDSQSVPRSGGSEEEHAADLGRGHGGREGTDRTDRSEQGHQNPGDTSDHGDRAKDRTRETDRHGGRRRGEAVGGTKGGDYRRKEEKERDAKDGAGERVRNIDRNPAVEKREEASKRSRGSGDRASKKDGRESSPGRDAGGLRNNYRDRDRDRGRERERDHRDRSRSREARDRERTRERRDRSKEDSDNRGRERDRDKGRGGGGGWRAEVERPADPTKDGRLVYMLCSMSMAD